MQTLIVRLVYEIYTSVSFAIFITTLVVLD